MSAIAEFRLIEKSKLGELSIAAGAVIKKGFFKSTVSDNYNAYLDANTKRLQDFDGSGYIYATLFVFLEEKGVDLLNNEFSDIANEISSKRENTTFIFTKEQRDKYWDVLNPELYTIGQLNDFNLNFSETDEQTFGFAALKAITALRQSLILIQSSNETLLLVID